MFAGLTKRDLASVAGVYAPALVERDIVDTLAAHDFMCRGVYAPALVERACTTTQAVP